VLGKRKRRQSEYLSFDEAIEVPLPGLRRWLGTDIPPPFDRCFVCRRPATALMCGLVSPQYARDEDDYEHEAARDLVVALRRHFASNLELPCCEDHKKGAPH
jgi:hypothetical protein